MGLPEFDPAAHERVSWNAGRKVGAKRTLKPRQIWAIRFFLDQHRQIRDRALFDLAIDSKLSGCDLVKIRINDIVCKKIRTRATVVQQKTGRPVQFELMDDVRASLLKWLELRGGSLEDYAFPSRNDHMTHISTRQYARLVDEWVTGIGFLRRAEVRSMFRCRARGKFATPVLAEASGLSLSLQHFNRCRSQVVNSVMAARTAGTWATSA